MNPPFLLGILGGMGPLATLDLQQKIIDLTPASCDQDHLPVIVWNVPQIPDRQQALAGTGASPLPQLLHALAQLDRLSVSHIAIPCNTAHHWFPHLAGASKARLLHIAHTTIAVLATMSPRPARVGLIATHGTLAAGWFQQALSSLGIEVLVPQETELKNWFKPGCYAVKRGDLRQGGILLDRLSAELVKRGAEQLILACTEVPPALNAIDSSFLPIALDPTQALAQACVDLWQKARTDLNHL